jgi:uncharacterized protein (PEP-CTERM system associated)
MDMVTRAQNQSEKEKGTASVQRTQLDRCRSRYCRRARFVVTGFLIASPPALPLASAENWHFQPSISGTAGYSDNINLAPKGQEKSDFYAIVAPRFRLVGQGARLQTSIDYQLQTYYYGSGDVSNRPSHSLAGTATLEAVKDFFFIDGLASISQASISPLGAAPVANGTVNSNRTETRTFSLGPYVRGVIPGADIGYLLRYTQAWTDTASSALSNSQSREWIAHLNSPPRLVGWDLDYNRRYTDFSGQPTFSTETLRFRPYYQPDPALRVYGSFGHESNNYATANQSGTIYGAGADYQPNGRFVANLLWEERFFGPSYSARISNRTPLSAWNIGYSRTNTTFPEQSLIVPSAAAQLLDAAFVSRFPDPVARQAAVQQFLQQSGIPANLTTPLTFFTNRIILIDRLDGSFVLTGVRNTLALAAFWSKSTSLSQTTGTTLPDTFNLGTDFVQRGGSVTFSHRLAEFLSLTSTVSRTHTTSTATSSAAAGGISEATQDLAQLQLTKTFSPRTNGSVGIRVQRFDTDDTATSFREKAVFTTVEHRFY